MKRNWSIAAVLALGMTAGVAITAKAQAIFLGNEIVLNPIADTAFTTPRWADVKDALKRTPPSMAILPAGAATAHYGFFCRQELRWDKKLPTQLRFRVGSFESCDRLEGKRRD